jgi:chromatin structure-remodeling complex subunit RSC1/2
MSSSKSSATVAVTLDDCSAYIAQLLLEPEATPFREPVDRRKYPDYYAVIKQPMALSNIQRKLTDGSYKDVNACMKDLELIWNNAKLYNMPGSEIWNVAHRYALQAKEFAEGKLKGKN